MKASTQNSDLEQQLIEVSRELKLTRRELAEQRNLFDRYFHLVDAIVITLDTEGQISRINRKGLESLGYSEAELVGQNWFQKCLPQPEGMEEVYPVFRDIMAGNLEAGRYIENSIQDCRGRRRLIAWHNNYFRDSNDKIIGTISSGEDITAQRMAEDEKSRLLERLKHALAQINTLHGILPLCSFCKRIRDDEGSWQQLEVYIHEHSDADISHGVCPDCARKHYPELFRGE